MLETEIKLRLADAGQFRAQLLEQGWSPVSTVFERNTVFDTPDGQLRESGRLLRVRQIDERAIVTVKLPADSDGPHKVREEHQFETDAPQEAAAVFTGLGYEPAWIYEKRRTEFSKEGAPGVIDFDEMPIGHFCELEGPADWIDATASDLGFSTDDYLVDTYRGLFERWLAETGSSVAHMTFDEIGGGGGR